MIVPDVNVLIYAYSETSPLHVKAKDWWEGLLNGSEEIGLPWSVSTGFVRLMANPMVVSPILEPLASWNVVSDWFEYPHVVPLNPGRNHIELMRETLGVAGISHSVVTDAHIAAIALEHDGEVHSKDSRFGRIPGLRWVDPLQ